MKKLGPMLVVLLLLAACGGDKGSETPEQAATKFLEALQSGDREDIYASVVRAEAESFQVVDERLDFNRWDDSNIEEFAIQGVVFDGNRARVTALVTREIDDKEVAGEEMIVCAQDPKDPKVWKVTMSASSKAFLPSGKRPD
jgi:hypothetical protein